MAVAMSATFFLCEGLSKFILLLNASKFGTLAAKELSIIKLPAATP
jgi:hypothetical protein